MIKCLELDNFRLFNNIKIRIGKKITILAGQNATGKSTVLGLIGASCQLDERSLIFQKQFKAKFEELFKASPEKDKSGTIAKITFTDKTFSKEIDYRYLRISWQNNKTRFRVIPFKYIENSSNNKKKKTDAKMKKPVLYTGLSRLFPLGEGIESPFKELKLDEEDKQWLIDKYNYILSNNENIRTIGKTNKMIAKNKYAIGIETEKYDFLANSAGQDNLGQILLNLLSLKKLNFVNGGVFLIDEFDATLHISAQIRLYETLYEIAEKYNIQIIFTTHSLSFLKYIYPKIEFNDKEKNNNIELVYFTTANEVLEVLQNPNIYLIENDLRISSGYKLNSKISVFSEDAEAQFFIENILEDYITKFNLVKAKLGCDVLMNLRKHDPKYFSNTIIILDGDYKKPIPNNYKNIIKLPGSYRPEKVLYDYLISLPPEHDYWNVCKEYPDYGFSRRYFLEMGPGKYDGKESEQYKKWFQDNLEGFKVTQLMKFWIDDNRDVVDKFINDFIVIHNKIAEGKQIPRIHKV